MEYLQWAIISTFYKHIDGTSLKLSGGGGSTSIYPLTSMKLKVCESLPMLDSICCPSRSSLCSLWGIVGEFIDKYLMHMCGYF